MTEKTAYSILDKLHNNPLRIRGELVHVCIDSANLHREFLFKVMYLSFRLIPDGMHVPKGYPLLARRRIDNTTYIWKLGDPPIHMATFGYTFTSNRKRSWKDFQQFCEQLYESPEKVVRKENL
jgi:hypothetical protein